MLEVAFFFIGECYAKVFSYDLSYIPSFGLKQSPFISRQFDLLVQVLVYRLAVLARR